MRLDLNLKFYVRFCVSLATALVLAYAPNAAFAADDSTPEVPPSTNSDSSQTSTSPYDHYYVFSEKLIPANTVVDNSHFIAPNDMIQQMITQVEAAVATAVSLLSFKQVNTPWPIPAEHYSRRKHFGASWVRPTVECYNTRAMILIRDSESPVEYNPKNNCAVYSGTWKDPYTDTIINQAKDLDIDHFVPLKNAYSSGAFDWQPSKRCNYANFIHNKFHLLSVSNIENRKKSDRGPEEYMPPNKNYACQYVEQWLKVKLLWKLNVTPPELMGINKILLDSSCDLVKMRINLDEFNDNRTAIDTPPETCSKLK